MAGRHRKRRKTKFRRRVKLYFRTGILLLVVSLLVLVGMKFFKLVPFSNEYVEMDTEKMQLEQPEIDVQLLTVNP